MIRVIFLPKGLVSEPEARDRRVNTLLALYSFQEIVLPAHMELPSADQCICSVWGHGLGGRCTRPATHGYACMQHSADPEYGIYFPLVMSEAISEQAIDAFIAESVGALAVTTAVQKTTLGAALRASLKRRLKGAAERKGPTSGNARKKAKRSEGL